MSVKHFSNTSFLTLHFISISTASWEVASQFRHQMFWFCYILLQFDFGYSIQHPEILQFVLWYDSVSQLKQDEIPYYAMPFIRIRTYTHINVPGTSNTRNCQEPHDLKPVPPVPPWCVADSVSGNMLCQDPTHNTQMRISSWVKCRQETRKVSYYLVKNKEDCM